MKIGIDSGILFFGGTFNPIHNGHILVSQNIAEQIRDISKIVLIPNGHPPHKRSETDSFHRRSMCEIVASQNDLFSVEDYEINKEGISHTLDTLYYLKEKYKIKNRINFLIGEDSFYSLDLWHKINDIFKISNIFVALEKPKIDDKFFHMRDKLENNYFQLPNIYHTPTPIIEIRSTIIRMRVKNKKSIYGMTPCKIVQYIKDNNLYIK